jgi:hypothetical protein
MNHTNQKIRTNLSALILFLFIGSTCFTSCKMAGGSSFKVEQALTEVANELNKKCPMQTDQDVIVVGEKTLQYNCTLVNFNKEQLHIEDGIKTLEPMFINKMKTDPTAKYFRDNNVTVSYHFSDKNGVYAFKIDITPEKYKN